MNPKAEGGGEHFRPLRPRTYDYMYICTSVLCAFPQQQPSLNAFDPDFPPHNIIHGVRIQALEC